MARQTKIEIEPSQRAFEAVRRLAREAFRTDGWMTPVVEDLMDEDTDDIGDLVMTHRSQWEQTCQFELLWGARISEIVDQQEARFERLDLAVRWEDRYYGLYEPLKEAFWEEWERKHKLVEQINEALAKKVPA